jgi:hypothetical protein
MPEVKIHDMTNNWVLETPETILILDAKTKRLRRFRNKRVGPYLGMRFDEEGKITHFNCFEGESSTAPSMKFRLTYTPEGQLESYEDIKGNYWKKEWGVQFLHVRELKVLFDLVNYYSWRMNIKLKAIIRNNPTINMTPMITIESPKHMEVEGAKPTLVFT